MEQSSPELTRQPRDIEGSPAPRETPREPPRHSQSNNWRVRQSGDLPPPTSTPSRDSRRTTDSPSNRSAKDIPDTGSNRPARDTPSNGSNRFARDNWRSSPGQSPAPSSPREPRQHGTSTSWRGRQPDSQRTSQDGVRDRGGSKPSSSLDDTSDALSEGRRIYLGNILYHVRPEEIREAAQTAGLGDIEQIHISVDPVTGRNPGYCFVEFATKETADAAIEAMSGVRIKGRPLKTGPCQPKRSARSDQRRRDGGGGGGGYAPTFARWGDWKADGNGVRLDGQGPVGAEEHLYDVVRDKARCRVFVSGLGKMINQEHNDRELREIFKSFQVAAVSKRITPHASTRALPGKHHYAFVDLETEEEALAAIEALNGREWDGGQLKVRPQADLPKEIEERGTRYENGEPKSG